MDINGTVISCPYWMNKIKDGKVTLRGFENGKSSAPHIRQELINRILKHPITLTPDSIRKFARRERIGIDCSGFAYRFFEKLITLGYNGAKGTLVNIFPGGINQTNVKALTNLEVSDQIKVVKDLRLGDMIRMWGGHHIAIITNVGQKHILYVHSSHMSTQIKGVHESKIIISNPEKKLEEQIWMEEGRKGKLFKEKYIPEKGDGVFRLKIFSLSC